MGFRQVLLVLLLAVFVGAVWLTMQNASGPPEPVGVQPPPESIAPTPPAGITPDPAATPETPVIPAEFKVPTRNPFELPPQLKSEIQRRVNEKRGPLTPSTTGPQVIQPPPLKLQGIFWGIARPQAIINRKIVFVGDTIEGCQITSITPDGVKFLFSEQEFTLTLPVKTGLSGGARGTYAPRY